MKIRKNFNKYQILNKNLSNLIKKKDKFKNKKIIKLRIMKLF